MALYDPYKPADKIIPLCDPYEGVIEDVQGLLIPTNQSYQSDEFCWKDSSPTHGALGRRAYDELQEPSPYIAKRLSTRQFDTNKDFVVALSWMKNFTEARKVPERPVTMIAPLVVSYKVNLARRPFTMGPKMDVDDYIAFCGR